MKINEIQPDSTISLSFHLKGKYFEFDLKVISNSEKYIITEPIRFNGAAVDLASANIGVNVIYTQPDSIPLVWRLVPCKKHVIDGKVMYKLVTTAEGVPCNRRSNFRLDISIDGIVQIGENTGTMEITVRDVSSSGFSFTTSKEIENSIGTMVRVVFFDSKYGGSFTINGTIVRTAKYREDVIVYGCHMCKEDQKLSKYIAAKQRARFSTSKKKRIEKETI